MSDINAIIETEPKLTEVQMEQIFKQMGDEYYHDDKIVDHLAAGEAGAGTSGHIFLTLDQRDGGRLEGMRMETYAYLDKALHDLDIDVNRLDVNTIPTFDEIDHVHE